tara:strand:- start:2616 stop:4052 length:1437 start_codon:yes stop_codon:yes gene_type:complete
MSLKSEAIKRFLTAARSLANQGLSKEAIMQFAKNEFGEITELFQKQIDSIFKRPASGIEKIKIKDEVFDDTVVKLPIDDQGKPFNPKDPLKQYDKPKKFRLNKERFQKDFNVSDEEVEKILKMSPEEQRDVVNKYIDKDFKERIELSDYDVTDLEPNAKGGIVGYYTGGMVDVEPNLSDIGHGSDALMARTRIMSPGGQATTSTGLNYLLAEDNDNIRVPFSSGYSAPSHKEYMKQMQTDLHKHFKRYKKDYGGKMKFNQFAPKFIKEYAEGGRIGFSKGKLANKARRKFMKAAGAGAAGLAALKTGLINFAQEAGPKVEMVKETVTGAPDYFFDLVSKIKMFGKKSKFGPQERVDEYSYQGINGDDYTLTEDIVTGDARIVKDKTGGVMVGEDEVVDGVANRSVMEYRSGKGMADEGTGGTLADEYDEYEVKFDMDGTEADADDISEIIKKEIIEETSDKTTKTKKASGGIARLLGE